MKIEFFSTVDGVADAYPILPAKKKIPNWMNEARKKFALGDKRETNIVKCPGIVDIMTTGFIVTAWHDIVVQSDNENVMPYAPTMDMEELLEKPPLQIQSGDGLAKEMPQRPWSSKHILKINTPWHIKADCKFLMIPVPYTDEFDIESTTGILDPSISSEINIQAYVNRHGEFTIKAGQPICQLIPLTEKSYGFDVRNMNDDDAKWVKKRKYLNNHGYTLNKGIVKKAYKKFLGGLKCPFK